MLKELNSTIKIITCFFVVSAIIFLLGGCNKNAIQPNAILQFNRDTVFVDTVITQLGTSTHELKVYNPYNKTVLISTIKMASGANSEYVFNVNGMGVGEKSDIELKPKDSIYIFIQAKLKKNNVDTFVVHNDKIQFILNDKVQEIPIISWGKDAAFYHKQSIQTTTWSAGKSFLIFDSVIVEAGQTLTIEEGATVLFKPRANLVIKGTLIVKGTIEKPVLFEGYRLESGYQNVPGQWGSIILASTSTGNSIQNATITDGTSGFQFQRSTGQIDLKLENVIINHMSYSGITCYGAKVAAVNCVFANCCSYILELKEGGDYRFTHTTISNNSSSYCSSVRNTASVYITNFKFDGATKVPKDIVEAVFQNSIISGYGNVEFETDSLIGALYNVKLLSCILEQKDKSTYMDANSVLFGSNMRLFSKAEHGFGLDSASIARNNGNLPIATQYPNDIKGRSRIVDGKPDIGAYEYFKDTTKFTH
jgi:hypothetical protein